jgi:hypothetical protein
MLSAIHQFENLDVIIDKFSDLKTWQIARLSKMKLWRRNSALAMIWFEASLRIVKIRVDLIREAN